MAPGPAPGKDSPPPFSPDRYSPVGKRDKSMEGGTVHVSTAYCGGVAAGNLTDWAVREASRTAGRPRGNGKQEEE